MNHTDALFQDILDYLYRDMLGENPRVETYRSDRPYYTLWKKGVDLILKGLSETTLKAALEYEKTILLNQNRLTDMERLEVILMEKMIFSIYSGTLYEIAEMAQEFATEALRTRYAAALHLLLDTDEDMEALYFSPDMTAALTTCKSGQKHLTEEGSDTTELSDLQNISRLALSFEIKFIQTIRNFINDPDGLRKLELPPEYLDAVTQILQKHPDTSDFNIAMYLRDRGISPQIK